MPHRVLVIDTSVLCCLLEVPGKETAGSKTEVWNKERVDATIKKRLEEGVLLVLPLATIIETGNHVAQAPRNRFELAEQLADIIKKTAKAETPWAAFTEQADLWTQEGLLELANTWPVLASTKFSIGDATIRKVAEYYAEIGWDVEILTGDAGLKAYEPPRLLHVPRRRK